MKITTCSYRPVLEPCELESFDYQVDPYLGCEHYCFYCYALNKAETDWLKEIHIHEDITGQLAEELKNIPPQKIYLGYKTDAYQPCEAECRQTRKVMELLLENGFSVSILTKSDLVLRDVDILSKMDPTSVCMSIAFNDDPTRQLFEARTQRIEARIEALGKLKAAGIPTAGMICPVIPYITDAPSLVETLAPLTGKIWIYGISFLDTSEKNWKNFQKILKKHFPNQKEKIEEVSLSKEHPYWTELRQQLEELQKKKQLELNIRL